MLNHYMLDNIPALHSISAFCSPSSLSFRSKFPFSINNLDCPHNPSSSENPFNLLNVLPFNSQLFLFYICRVLSLFRLQFMAVSFLIAIRSLFASQGGEISLYLPVLHRRWPVQLHSNQISEISQFDSILLFSQRFPHSQAGSCHTR
jgi:hypothetical protein